MKIGHSSKIELWMRYGAGYTAMLSQVAPEFVVFTDSIELPPCEGRCVVIVDGEEMVRHVYMPNGVKRDEWKTPIETIGGDE